LKKKSKNPRARLASKLVGDKLARRLQHNNVDELLDSITLTGQSLRRVTKSKN